MFGLKVVCRNAKLRQALAFVYEVTNIKRPSQSFIMFLMLINLNSPFFRYFASDNIVVFKSLVSRVWCLFAWTRTFQVGRWSPYPVLPILEMGNKNMWGYLFKSAGCWRTGRGGPCPTLRGPKNRSALCMCYVQRALGYGVSSNYLTIIFFTLSPFFTM